jgi:putative integral membrane protein (TIGR02587 family)
VRQRGQKVAQVDQTERKAKSVNGVLKGLGRGFGGALIFALPLFMTMEMWWLGFYIDRSRLVLLLVVNIPLLTVLSRHAGFEKTRRWYEDLRDAGIAFGIGIVACAAILTVLAIIRGGMTADEIVGKIAIQSVPASIGALLGSSQLGAHSIDTEEHSESQSYLSELFVMGIGALFLCLNVAPTEEMVQISYKMTEWNAVVLICLSIVVMHAFTYALEFTGTVPMPESGPMGEVVLLFRPACSPVKVDQGFLSGCHSYGFGFAGMDLIWGQDAVGGVGPLGVVIGQPFPNTVSGL